MKYDAKTKDQIEEEKKTNQRINADDCETPPPPPLLILETQTARRSTGSLRSERNISKLQISTSEAREHRNAPPPLPFPPPSQKKRERSRRPLIPVALQTSA
ncbi:Hypothetical predicted protein [Scomber scombrus]|uniref:Uncharacterized protein n=1 Tax=Scomber scombrus TaxID=13677 RepID=A0AAV1PH04_SCOSC